MREEFYIAEVDDLRRPVRRLSGVFQERAPALRVLTWLRRRCPRAALVHARLFVSVELAA